MELTTLALAISVGIILGLVTGSKFEQRHQRKLVQESIEEGFRTFIEHNLDTIDRDGDAANKLWERSVSRKKTEMFAREFMKNRQ